MDRATDSPADQTAFGRVLRQLRLDASLTQETLAAKAGMSVRGIQLLEAGARWPHRDTVERLIGGLGLSGQVRDRLVALAQPVPRRGKVVPFRARALSGHRSSLPGRVVGRTDHPGSPANNLPLQLSSFVGRERELAEVRRLLGTTRLLTLTGSGGCGKTRLAYQGAEQILQERSEVFPDGVWVVELGHLADSALVPQALADALGVRDQPGVAIETTLLGVIGARQLLVVLDNCEHLAGAVARLASTLLSHCPGLRLLATSREPLRVPGEVTWRVPSMSTPGQEQLHALGQDAANAIAGYDAVRLFVGRAELAQPGFALDEENAYAVGQLCRRLDGIPLALELAATRVRGLGVEQILSRLDQPFSLLTGGARTALTRQQTLRATLDWSYDLLSEPVRLLLRRLAVFAGGFTLEAAEAVGACRGARDEVELASSPVLDLVLSLVDKSLVIAEDAGGSARYRLLETIGQYALEKLVASGEEPAVRAEHAAYFLSLAEEAKPTLYGPREREWLDQLEAEIDNIRAALRWLEGVGDAEGGLRLALGLLRLWAQRGPYGEGVAWLTALLGLPGAKQTPVGVEALAMLATSTHITKSADAARPIAEEALEIARALGDRGALAYALWMTGGLAADHQAAYRDLAEAAAAFREAGNEALYANCLRRLGQRASATGDLMAARAYYEESLGVLRVLGSPEQIANALHHLALAISMQGDLSTAWKLYEECLGFLRQDGNRTFVAHPTLGKATLMRLRGEYEGARDIAEESLSLDQELGDQNGIPAALDELGLIASAQGDADLARLYLEQALANSRQRHNRGGVAQALAHLGLVARGEGDLEQARELLTESLAIQRELGARHGVAVCLANLGVVALQEAKLNEAETLVLEGLALRREMGDRGGRAMLLETLGGLAVLRGQAERALRLAGAAERVREESGNIAPPAWRKQRDPWLESARQALDPERADHAFAEGQEMTLEQAVEYALRDEAETAET